MATHSSTLAWKMYIYICTYTYIHIYCQGLRRDTWVGDGYLIPSINYFLFLRQDCWDLAFIMIRVDRLADTV